MVNTLEFSQEWRHTAEVYQHCLSEWMHWVSRLTEVLLFFGGGGEGNKNVLQQSHYNIWIRLRRAAWPWALVVQWPCRRRWHRSLPWDRSLSEAAESVGRMPGWQRPSPQAGQCHTQSLSRWPDAPCPHGIQSLASGVAQSSTPWTPVKHIQILEQLFFFLLFFLFFLFCFFFGGGGGGYQKLSQISSSKKVRICTCNHLPSIFLWALSLTNPAAASTHCSQTSSKQTNKKTNLCPLVCLCPQVPWPPTIQDLLSHWTCPRPHDLPMTMVYPVTKPARILLSPRHSTVLRFCVTETALIFKSPWPPTI